MKIHLIYQKFFIILFCSLPACNKNSVQNKALIPVCIQNKINIFKNEPKANPPRSIIQYTYKDKRVFYLPAQCCDQFSDVIDENCNLLGHPDGGITGKGDGKLPDFAAEAKDEKLIWKDDR